MTCLLQIAAELIQLVSGKQVEAYNTKGAKKAQDAIGGGAYDVSVFQFFINACCADAVVWCCDAVIVKARDTNFLNINKLATNTQKKIENGH